MSFHLIDLVTEIIEGIDLLVGLENVNISETWSTKVIFADFRKTVVTTMSSQMHMAEKVHKNVVLYVMTHIWKEIMKMCYQIM